MITYIKERIFLIKRRIRFIYQKLTRGFSDDEMWDLGGDTIKYVLPRLKRYREICPCYPGWHTSLEEWRKDLDDMIYAFEIYSKDSPVLKYNRRRYKRGMRLFGENLRALWW